MVIWPRTRKAIFTAIHYEGGSFDCQGPGCGVLFEVDTKDNEAILHVFLTSDPAGIIPFCGLIRDQAGNLYGTSNAGGAFPENGTIFKLHPSEVVPYKLPAASRIKAPKGPLPSVPPMKL